MQHILMDGCSPHFTEEFDKNISRSIYISIHHNVTIWTNKGLCQFGMNMSTTIMEVFCCFHFGKKRINSFVFLPMLGENFNTLSRILFGSKFQCEFASFCKTRSYALRRSFIAPSRTSYGIPKTHFNESSLKISDVEFNHFALKLFLERIYRKSVTVVVVTKNPAILVIG